MRRIFLCVLSCLCVLCGCGKVSKEEQENIKIYENYIDAVDKNKGVVSKYIPFDYKMYVYKQEDDTYKYEIEIYNPQMAMYNIQAIAVDQDIDSNQNVYPCLGILGEDAQTQYHMIPYQSYGKKGYIKMIILDAVSKRNQFTVNVMVTWKDKTLRNTTRVFFNCSYAQEKGDTEKGEKQTSDSGKSDTQ